MKDHLTDHSTDSTQSGFEPSPHDGYIRMPLHRMYALPLLHVYSEECEGFLIELRAQSIAARLAGFCEWRSAVSPAISLGWSWYVHSTSHRMLLAPDGVRGNLMLIDTHGYDLGTRQTSILLDAWLSLFEWQPTVRKALGHDMACQL